VLILRGRGALSPARRARALAKVRGAGAEALDARWVHVIDGELDAEQRAQLDHMLAYGPTIDVSAAATIAPAAKRLWVAPRLGTTSPWSSKATDIARVCGLVIRRIERALEYTLGRIE